MEADSFTPRPVRQVRKRSKWVRWILGRYKEWFEWRVDLPNGQHLTFPHSVEGIRMADKAADNCRRLYAGSQQGK